MKDLIRSGYPRRFLFHGSEGDIISPICDKEYCGSLTSYDAPSYPGFHKDQDYAFCRYICLECAQAKKAVREQAQTMFKDIIWESDPDVCLGDLMSNQATTLFINQFMASTII